MKIQENGMKDSFSRDEVLAMLASLMNLWNPDDLEWQIAQYMKQMGIDSEPDPDKILWELHFKGIRYPNGEPLIDPEFEEKLEEYIRKEQEMSG
jgi:hypothetical protein